MSATHMVTLCGVQRVAPMRRSSRSASRDHALVALCMTAGLLNSATSSKEGTHSQGPRSVYLLIPSTPGPTAVPRNIHAGPQPHVKLGVPGDRPTLLGPTWE